MTALAADRIVKRRHNDGDRSYALKLAASVTAYKGGMAAVITTGYAQPAATTAGMRVQGIFESAKVVNSGAAGAKEAQVTTGCFLMKNSGTNPVAQADVGRHCYVEDDQTVQDENGGSAVVAGLVVGVETAGVWVYIAPEVSMFGAQFTGIETVNSGALSLYTRTSILSVTGTVAFTLAAGLFEGQRKTLYCSVAASTPAGTLTPSLLAGGTTLAFNAVDDSCELEWHDASGWNVVTKNSVTLA